MVAVDWAAGDEVEADDLDRMENGHLMTPSVATTVASTTTEGFLAQVTIPANDAVAGQAYRLRAYGTFGVTATPTLNIRPRLGGLSGSSWAQTGAQTIQSGVTNRLWLAEITLVCETPGAAATWSGPLQVQMAGVNAGTAPFIDGEVTRIIDGTASFTLDSTVSNIFGITATWSAANAANTITCKGFTAERLIP